MAVIDLTAQFPLVDTTYRPLYGSTGDITDLAIHYTLTTMPETATQEQEEAHLQGIYEFHVVGRGWGGIAYHGVGFPSGRAYKTAPWERWGTNVKGNNDHLLGFAGVYAGDIVPPGKTLEAFRKLIAAADGYLGGYTRPISGHRDFIATGCPGNKWQQWIPTLRQEDDMLDPEADKATFAELMEWWFTSGDQGTLGPHSRSANPKFNGHTFAEVVGSLVESMHGPHGGGGYTDQDAVKAVKDAL